MASRLLNISDSVPSCQVLVGRLLKPKSCRQPSAFELLLPSAFRFRVHQIGFLLRFSDGEFMVELHQQLLRECLACAIHSAVVEHLNKQAPVFGTNESHSLRLLSLDHD